MKKTSLMLPENLRNQANYEAQKLGISLGEFVRRAIELMLKPSVSKPNQDPLLSRFQVFRQSNEKHLSVHHDDEIYRDEK